jgi:ArsR family transcriptional regulator, arsenate/arsenite/antimonite-responsive transcriptional repressor
MKATNTIIQLSEQQVVNALSALAHPQRLRAFRALVVAGPEGLTPSDMSAQLDIAPSALSFHLKELSHSGLVSIEPNGRYQIYRAAFDAMQSLMDYLTENCCQGAGCKPARSSSKSSSSRSCK